jgi:hypothetical protein
VKKRVVVMGVAWMQGLQVVQLPWLQSSGDSKVCSKMNTLDEEKRFSACSSF